MNVFFVVEEEKGDCNMQYILQRSVSHHNKPY